MHLVYPPPSRTKIAYRLSSISLGTTVIPRWNRKQCMVMQNFGNKVHCGLCENGDWNVTWFSAGSGGGGLLLDDSKSGLVWTKIGWELLFCTLITFLGTRLYSCSVSMCVFMLFRQCILHSYFVVIFFSEILLLSITFVLKGKYYLNCFCIFSVPRFAISSTTGLEVEKRPFNTVKN